MHSFSLNYSPNSRGSKSTPDVGKMKGGTDPGDVDHWFDAWRIRALEYMTGKGGYKVMVRAVPLWALCMSTCARYTF